MLVLRSPDSGRNDDYPRITTRLKTMSIADLSGFSETDLVVLLQDLVRGDVPTNIKGVPQKTLDMMTLLHAVAPPQPAPERDVAALEAVRRGHVDYFRSRAIKTHLVPEKEVDGRLYDRDTAPGSFVRIADAVRAARNIPRGDGPAADTDPDA